ncbi:Cerato-platanin [Fomitopsis serialis]|uniref:Cerato-platanin n=1 Tax=Fomitopsis serialis TaxID=139415 RepID=UPI0020089DCB|nr:Cerato-platanin [Neoantrodia serialis]KAH9934640.1 Cerato-platanin [Neoantrodia serialis]
MKLSALVASLALLASSVVAQTAVTVSYDQTYDNVDGSMLTVACSDGPTGLDPPYETFGSLPNFPFIGGAAVVTGWGSTECGSCWELSYTSPEGVESTINVLAIDYAGAGFNIALEALNALTDGQAQFLGRVNATATSVDAAACGL